MIICRALVELYSHPLLVEQLALRDGTALSSFISRQPSKSGNEVLPVPFFIHYPSLLDPPHYHMMQGPRRIQSSLPWHSFSYRYFRMLPTYSNIFDGKFTLTTTLGLSMPRTITCCKIPGISNLAKRGIDKI